MVKIAMRVIVLVAAAAAMWWLTLANWRAYRPGRVEPAIAQLRFLEKALEDGAAERMQRSFPEGFVFTWALSGLASANILRAVADSGIDRAWLERIAASAVRHVQSEKARSTFVQELTPEYGAFYSSWSLYLRSNILQALGSPGAVPFDVGEFDRDCEAFASALRSGADPFLPSYPGQAWPADTGVGVAALAIRDAVLGARYTPVIAAWVAAVQQAVDRSNGAIPHAAGVMQGWPGDGPRGESLALLSLVLADVDKRLAEQQYDILRSRFVDYVWGVPGVREYPHGLAGRGDVDSGPVLLGFSAPAIVVGAGAALVHGDDDVADALLATAEIFGLPIEILGRRRYAGGFLPVGDAFLAWARSMSIPRTSRALSYDRVIPQWWRLPFHAMSLLILTVLIVVAVKAVRALNVSYSGRRHSTLDFVFYG